MAMGKRLNVWQVVGYSNSGKTTLVEQLLHAATMNGKRVATIKHHGHANKLATLDQGKDSSRHRQAGALGSAVVANGILQLQIEQERSWGVDEVLGMYQALQLDAVLIEGFKYEAFPKIAIVRNHADYESLKTLANVKALLCWDDFAHSSESVVTFRTSESLQLASWLLEQWRVKE